MSVTVTGPPADICFLNRGMTLPFEAITLPNRTATKSVSGHFLSIICTIISHMRFVAPMMFVGLTALSVDMSTNLETPYFAAVFCVHCGASFHDLLL